MPIYKAIFVAVLSLLCHQLIGWWQKLHISIRLVS